MHFANDIKLQHNLFIRESTYLPYLQPIILYRLKLEKNEERMRIVETRRLENDQNEMQLVSQQRSINKKLLLITKTLQREKLYIKTPNPCSLRAVTICPDPDCVGFIMEAKNEYSCGMCNMIVCSSCFKHKTNNYTRMYTSS